MAVDGLSKRCQYGTLAAMSHTVEVDQSGRIEFTTEDTALAFSNGVSFTVLIPKSVKRACIKELRAQGRAGATFYFQLFAVGLFFLFQNHIERLATIIIDTEFEGNEPQIKEHLLNLLKRNGYKIDPEQIGFGHIGKHSPAHHRALATLRKQEKPRLCLTIS